MKGLVLLLVALTFGAAVFGMPLAALALFFCAVVLAIRGGLL